MNLETIIDTRSWCKTWLHNGYNPTHACETKISQETQKRACRSSWSRPGNQKSCTLTILWHLAMLVKLLTFNHCTSTPHRSETNGITERAVRIIKEGTSAVLLQSGLDEKWWADSMECYFFLRNIQDLLSDGKTPHERITPFLLKTHRDCIRSVLKSCQVYSLDMCCPLEESGKGDIMVRDIEELEEMDASELHARRLNTKEVLTPMKGDNFYFLGRRWNSQNFWRRSTSEIVHLNPGSSRTKRGTRSSSKENETNSPLQPLFKRDSTRDDAEAKNDFLVCYRRFHFSPSRGTQSRAATC